MSLTSAKTERKHVSAGENEKKESQNDLFLNDFTETGTVRVGKDYQAVIPPLENDRTLIKDEHAILMWSNPESMSELQFYEYMQVAGVQYKFGVEQALGILQWHGHDIKGALKDLPLYVPVSDEWSVEDILVFEQAFAFNGKCFHRIQQMLPNKSMAALVKFYYSWKKRARNEASYIEHCEKRKNCSEDDEDSEESYLKKRIGSRDSYCLNCFARSPQLYDSPHGKLCQTCFIYFRRSGNLRDVDRKVVPDDLLDDESSSSSKSKIAQATADERKHKIPKNMNINMNDFKELVERPSPEHLTPSDVASRDKEHEKIQREIRQWRQRAGVNRQTLATMRDTVRKDINQLFAKMPPRHRSKPQKTNSKWSQHEIMLVLQGFRMFGRKFHCISELIGTKTTDHVRSFYGNNRHRYRLDHLVKELEDQKRSDKMSNESTVVQLSDDDDCVDNNGQQSKDTEIVVLIDED